MISQLAVGLLLAVILLASVQAAVLLPANDTISAAQFLVASFSLFAFSVLTTMIFVASKVWLLNITLSCSDL